MTDPPETDSRRPSPARTRRAVLGSVAASSVGVLAGCLGSSGGSSPPVDELDLSIIDLREPSLGATTATLTLVVEVVNNASRELQNPQGQFKIYVGDVHVASATPTFPTLAGGERFTDRISVIVEYQKVSVGVVESIRSGFSLRLDGTITSGEATREIEAEFEYP